MTTNNMPDVVGELRERLAAIQQRTTAAPAGSFPGGTARSAGQRSGPDEDPSAHRADASDADSDAPDSGEPHSGAPSAGPAQDEADREEEQLAKAITLRLLADSARPRAGLEQKLLRRGIRPEVITRVLDRFTDVGLIDDQAYAEAYVRSKHQERALSRAALASELRRKGIDETSVGVAVEQVDGDAEEARATALIAKRAANALAAGPEAARRRLLALLDRRGYPADMSIRVVENALRDQAELGTD